MQRIDELFRLYSSHMNCVASKNEPIKKICFFILLSQMLRIPSYDKQFYHKTVPIAYEHYGVPYSCRLHGFICQTSGTAKGKIMSGVTDVFRDFCARSGDETLRAHYVSREPTAAFMQGGCEQVYDKKTKAMQWTYKPGVLQTQNLISWGEGKSLIAPSSQYGDLKELILTATDIVGIVSATARKDLIIGEENRIPFYKTSTSIIAGSVYKDEFHSELLNSGMFRRFLFHYKRVCPTEQVNALNEYNAGLLSEEKTSKNETLREFMDYFMKNIYMKYQPLPLVWDVSGREALEEIMGKVKEVSCNYSGENEEVLSMLTTSVDEHTKKVAALIAAVDYGAVIDYDHVMYAWENVTKDTFDSLLDILESKFTPEYTRDEMKRVDLVREIFAGGIILQKKEVLKKMEAAKRINRWDLGYNKTLEYLDKMVKREILQMVERGNGKFYRLKVE